MLKESLHLAELGYRLLPCNGKKPSLEDWPRKASNDPERLREWFGSEERNIGLLCGEVAVVDIDADENRSKGRDFFKMHRNRIKSIVLTPHGEHFFFRSDGLEIPNAVKTTIDGIVCDFRSRHGYVIHPASSISGNLYKYVEGFELPKPLKLEPFDPKWIPQKETKAKSIVEDDMLRRITRARFWLAKHEPAISGQGGHKQMFSACCWMFQRFGLTVSEAWPLILEYNERCVPPFSESELKHKIQDAAKQPITH